jgi:hypothetical protein
MSNKKETKQTGKGNDREARLKKHDATALAQAGRKLSESTAKKESPKQAAPTSETNTEPTAAAIGAKTEAAREEGAPPNDQGVAETANAQVVGYRFMDVTEDASAEGVTSLFVYPDTQALEAAIEHYKSVRGKNTEVMSETILWNGDTYFVRSEDLDVTVSFAETGRLPAEYHK